MGRIINFIILAIIVGAAVVYFTMGPSVFLGGPTKSAIVDVTRKVMESTAPSPELAAAAKAAQITPTGLCSKQDDGVFACAVDVVVAGTPSTTFVSELKKDQDGIWVAK